MASAVRPSYEEGRLSVPLPATASPADTFLVEVDYSGVPDDGLIFRRQRARAPVGLRRQLAEPGPLLVPLGGPSLRQGDGRASRPRAGGVAWW